MIVRNGMWPKGKDIGPSPCVSAHRYSGSLVVGIVEERPVEITESDRSGIARDRVRYSKPPSGDDAVMRRREQLRQAASRRRIKMRMTSEGSPDTGEG